MISHDWILIQVRQLAQALSQVLLHKRQGEQEQAQGVLRSTLQEVTGLEWDQLQQLEPTELLELCSRGGALDTDKAVVMADLLSEDSAAASRRRALWLYEAALDSGGAVPLDVQVRLAALRSSLREE